MHDPKRPAANKYSFFIDLVFNKGIINPHKVETSQNIDVYFVAYYFVANYYKTANDEIHPPKPTSSPTYIKNMNEVKIYIL
jgi:hypothetical protein